MKNLLVVAMLLTVISFCAAQSVDSIPNLQHPQFQIYTAGQPTEDGFRQAAEMGIKTVINVLPEKDCIPDEARIVTANGMTYITLPFETTGLKKETVDRFAAILHNAQKPVLIHCRTGNHVGGLWFAYRVLSQDTPLWLALKEGRQVGMNAQMEDNLFDWVYKQKS